MQDMINGAKKVKVRVANTSLYVTTQKQEVLFLVESLGGWHKVSTSTKGRTTYVDVLEEQ